MIRYVEQEKIRLPYSIATVIKQQRRLLDDVPLKKFIGRSMDRSLLRSMAEYLKYKVRKDTIPLSFYENTLDLFRSRIIEDRQMSILLRRIAAVAELPERPLTPAVPWIQQLADEWVPIEVESVVKKQGNEQIWLFKCCALGGRMADVRFDCSVSLKRAFRFAKMSGFNQRSEWKRLHDPRQFVRLRLLLNVLKGSTFSSVRIGDCGEHPPIVTYNRKLNRLRDPELRVCCYRMRVPCFRCGVGTDQCPVAVQEQTDNDQLIFNIGNNNGQHGYYRYY
jgi:hypothetical protein